MPFRPTRRRKSLDPHYGRAQSGVTYIVFTGSSGTVWRNEDHDEAVAVGTARAQQLVDDN